MGYDPATINAIDEKIGKQRQLKAALIAENQQHFDTLQGLEARESELGAIENLTEDQAKDLEAVNKSLRETAVKIRDNSAKANKCDSEIAQLVERREMAVEHQRQLSAAQASQQRQSGHDPLTPPATGGGSVLVLPPTKEQILEDFADIIRAKYISNRDHVPMRAVFAGEIGPEFRNDRLVSAFTQSGNSTLFPQHYVPVLIEYLRAPQIIRNLPITPVDLVNGNYSQTRQTGTTSGNYVGEQVYATPSDPTVGALTMTAKKCFYLTVASGEALRRSSPAANQMIRRDLQESLTRKEDLQFIRGTQAATTPGGLKWYADQDAANQRITANATVTIANIQADLGKLMLLLANSNIPMMGVYWVMSTRTYLYLKNLRTTQEVYAFPEMQMDMLNGIPVKHTTAIPNNLGAGTDASEVYLFKASELLIGDTDYLGLDMSDTAAYDDSGTIKAAFSNDSAVFRLITETDTELRHRTSVVYAQTVKWYAA